MAGLYGRRQQETPLSDGSVLKFRRPRASQVDEARIVGWRRIRERADALKDFISTDAAAEAAATSPATDAAPAAVEPEAPSNPTPDQVAAEAWREFANVDHVTLIDACIISWKHDGKPVLEDGQGVDELPLVALHEAASAIYESYVGRPAEVRGN